MRIGVVTGYYKPAYGYGGPARSIPAMCEALAQLGAQVTVFTTNANRPARLEVPLRQPLNVDGVTVWYFPLSLDGQFFYSRALAQACRERLGEFDLAVLELLWAQAMGPAGRACIRAGVPYVVPLRGQLQPWSRKHKFWKKWLYFNLFARRYLNRAAALHCTDRAEAASLAGLGLRAPSFVVPNAVDAARFARLPARGALRRRDGIAPDALVVLFLGRLIPAKRLDIALEAVAAARSLNREVHLLVAGPDEGKLAPGLVARAQELGVADRLHLVGLLNGDEVLSALADADLLIMPSEVQENFGMAAAEALAAGVPILVSDLVPVGRWAEAAGAGRAVPCTRAAFAGALRELLAAPERLPAMGERGKALVQQQFDLPVVAGQLLAQYRSIVATGKPGPPQFPTG